MQSVNGVEITAGKKNTEYRPYMIMNKGCQEQHERFICAGAAKNCVAKTMNIVNSIWTVCSLYDSP